MVSQLMLCLKDMKSQSNRIDYPFLNCTNCGPRFTIVSELPYDRQHTTMPSPANLLLRQEPLRSRT